MSGLNVEALLDATAQGPERKNPNGDDASKNSQQDRDQDRDRERRDGSRPRDRDRDYDRRRKDRRDRDLSPNRSRRGTPDVGTPRSDTGSHKSRRRSRSRDDDRRHSRRSRDGDYYRGARGRTRSRSRSPYGRYRPRDDRDRRDRRDRHDYGRGRDHGRRDSGPDATPTEDERDRRTVFVQQLAARLRTRELKEFFEKVGPVNEAQIVKDRISQRSKG